MDEGWEGFEPPGAAAVCWISVVGKVQGWVEVAVLLN